MVNFQKQFDVVTGALNIFDMSYLVSGATLLGVLVYAFPDLKDYVYHKDQVLLSLLICVIFAYVLGIVSWIAGKQIRYWMMSRFWEMKTNDEDFESKFKETAHCFEFKNETVKKLMAEDLNVAYSYMWVCLDKSQDDECRSRFVYASRFWVLRAIYEGLIPPVLILAATILVKYFSVWKGWCEIFSQWQSDFTKMVLLSWFENIIVTVFGSAVMLSFALIVVRLLAMEARRCANTQIREVIVAYYHFVEAKGYVRPIAECIIHEQPEQRDNPVIAFLRRVKKIVRNIF